MVAILLGNGFEPVEAIAPCDILRRGGVEVKLASVHPQRLVHGGQGVRVEADCLVSDLRAQDLDMVVLPGGLGGVESILASEEALALVKAVHAAGRYVAAICAAPTILAKLHITDGKRATCYPGMEAHMGSASMTGAPTEQDGTILTGRAAGSAEAFGLRLLAALHGEAAAAAVADQIVSTGV